MAPGGSDAPGHFVMEKPLRVAIIGAGIAGLSSAIGLQACGHQVTLFDKGRGAGGRMSTRIVEAPLGAVTFDYGAQYITARDPAFRAAIAEWQSADVVAAWPIAGSDAWVGTPGMNAIVKHLATQATVRWNHRVDSFRRTGAGWHVGNSAEEIFDAVITATPAEQAAPLLAPHDPLMASEALACRSAPCWTAMLAFAAPLAIADDIIADAGIIGWAARNSGKPGRGGGEAWVVQAASDWSLAHLEDPVDAVVERLTAALAEHVAGEMPVPIARSGHRWRYARTIPTDLGCLWNADEMLGAAGDWLLGPRVESAWLSGRRLAERISHTHAVQESAVDIADPGAPASVMARF